MKLPLFNTFRRGNCTCLPKYNLNTYLGRCAHQCVYCYATKFPTFNGPPRPRLKLLEQIENMVAHSKEKMPVMLSDCTDPYQPLEIEYEVTRKCIQTLVRHEFPLLIVTKSDLLTRDVYLFKQTLTVVSMTITTLKEDISSLFEPQAPSPERRLGALQKIIKEGIPATVRVDPIIPGVNDDAGEFEKLVSVLADMGVRQVTVATVKPVRGFFSALKQMDLKVYEKLVRLFADGKWIAGYKYLSETKRREIVGKLRPIVLKHGLEFACCREGFPSLNTTLCDGTAYCRSKLLNGFFRSDWEKIYK